MRRFAVFLSSLLILIGFTNIASAQSKGPLVLAAASLQESMTAAADRWAQMGHPKPVISFAGSSALARQIEAGAPADLFASADQEWMDALQKKGLIVPASRATFVANRLVVVAPNDSKARADMAHPAALAKLLASGPVAMANTDAVPAGKYGKAALTSLGIWSQVSPHVVQAENVRAALALVERGAAPMGIVYSTDAKASPKVKVIGIFPEKTHVPITYPVARLKSSTNPQAEGFRRFLTSRAGKAIFARYGFYPR